MHTLKTNYKFLLISLLFIGTSLTIKSQTTDVVPGELIIKWKTNRKERINSTYPNVLTIKGKRIKEINGTNIEVWKLPIARGNELSALIQEYKNHPDIEFIEPNYIYKSFEVIPNDPLFNEQWGLENIDQAGSVINADIAATDAWEIQNHSRSVKVAITDSGIDWIHPDLVQNIWQNLAEDIDGDGSVLEWTGTQWIFDPDDENGIDDDGNGYVDDFIGWDFRDNDNNPMDFDGHGTHVAGIVGARGNNSLGISGVTWDVQLVPLRIIGNGSLRVADAIEAIHYTTLMNIPISNNSWGGKNFSGLLFNAIEETAAKNHLFISAAGNDSIDTDVHHIYPGFFDLANILNVAASDTLDISANFKVGSSNFGANSVDIYAPGLHIFSCLPNGTYGTRSGTSMAAPFVAGVCALIKDRFPNKAYLEIKNEVLEAVDPISNLSGKCVSGGRLNLFNVLILNEGNCAYRDSLALVDLYHSTNGGNWVNKWDLATPIITWYGITLNQVGCVEKIHLEDNGLVGSIPNDIGNILKLRELILSNNQINGSIPTSIGRLVELRKLILNNNQITGNIPGEMVNTSIYDLDLSYNQLDGSFPVEILAITGSLSSLRFMNISHNNLTGNIPTSIPRLINLYELYLNNNQFSGSIPRELSKLNYIRKINLSNNQFSGSIPEELGELSRLSEIFLQKNNLSGCFSNNLSSFCNIIYDFSGNTELPEGGNFNLACNTSSGFCSTCTINDSLALIALYNATNGNNWKEQVRWNLTEPITSWNGITTNAEGCVIEIDLHSYGLVGTIPPAIDHFQSLQFLSLSNNELTDTIPAEIGNLPNLEILYLDRNKFTVIPPEIGNLLKLKRLIAYSNNLKTLTKEIFNLYLLEELNLYDNQIADTIHSEIQNLSKLQRLSLWRNEITGKIPSEIGNLLELEILTLASNKLTGTIPLEIFDLKNLTTLNLRFNRLSGNLSSKISNLTNLTGLILDYNSFEGVIPSEIGDLPQLHSLYLSNNSWSGSIPSEITQLINLRTLYLDRSGISGILPVDFGKLTNLTQLSLAYNDIEGCFPQSLITLCNNNLENAFLNTNLPNNGDFTAFCTESAGACPSSVYPGDFNSDGIANKEDVLYWALAQSNTGILRPNASTEWYGQECPDWETTVLEVDNKHQDGDGNGIINEADLEVLEMNYGKIHGYTSFTAITNGTTYELTTTNFMEDTLQIALNLDVGGVSTGLHGIAASIDFGDLGIDSILFDFSNSALNPSHHLVMYDEVNNVLDIALTRTNKQDTICQGEMGILWIIMADGIDLDDEISIAAKNGSMIQADGNLNAIGDAVMFSTYSLPTSNNNLVTSISFSPVACDQLGSASVTVNGGMIPYTYQWSTGATSAAITELTEGDYNVTITDANGLTKDYAIEIEGQYIPVYDEDGELVDCNPTYCQPNLVLENSFENKIYQAAHSIQASGLITPSNEVVFKAGDSILLQPGFTVEAGGIFQAQIADCTNTNLNNNENTNKFKMLTANRNTSLSTSINPTWIPKQSNILVNPNPTHQNAIIDYEVPIATKLNLTLTDIQRRTVQLLQKDVFVEAGKHQYLFAGNQLPNGMYMIHLQTEQALITSKLMLLK